MTALHVERCLPEGYLDRALRADARAGLSASSKTLPPKSENEGGSTTQSVQRRSPAERRNWSTPERTSSPEAPFSFRFSAAQSR